MTPPVWVLRYTPMIDVGQDEHGHTLYVFDNTQEIGRFDTYERALGHTFGEWENYSNTHIRIPFGYWAIDREDQS